MHLTTNLTSSSGKGFLLIKYLFRGLGSCGAKFEKGEKRKEIFFKKAPYTNETYFEYDQYAHSPTS